MTPRELRDLDLDLAKLLGWTNIVKEPGDHWDFYRGSPPHSSVTVQIPYLSSNEMEAARLLDDIDKWGCSIRIRNKPRDRCGSGFRCILERDTISSDESGTTFAEAVALAAKAFLEAVNKRKEEDERTAADG